MNVLLIGLGSIGLRHLKNLVHLKIKKISVVRRNKKAHENFNIYDSIESAFKNQSFSHVIISNPSSLHFKAFLIPIFCAFAIPKLELFFL